ncbi:MAG: M28 family peptidase [Bacteriovoracaceae bacterium]|nr:M28 family peptidase [Bacteriovoracaceae bacterium]
MKNITLVLALIFSLSVSAYTVAGKKSRPSKVRDIKSLISKYRKSDLESILRKFIKVSSPSRFVGSSGHRNGAKFIIDQIKSGQKDNNELLIVDDFVPPFKEVIDRFQAKFVTMTESSSPANNPNYKLWNNYTNSMIAALSSVRSVGGKNIVWEKKGSVYPNEVLVLGAHYDTISIDKETLMVSSFAQMPGADNNGSGVTALLAMIEVLQNLEIKRTVRVVFFDFEEMGHIGSQVYAKKHLSVKDGKKYAGFINPIMIGSDGVFRDKTKKKGNMKLYGRKKNSSDKSLANTIQKIGSKVSTGVKFKYLDNSFERSSVISFWKYDIPTLVVSHDYENDPNDVRQHTPDDFVETLNLKTFYNSFKYLTGSVIGWANGIK